MARKKFLMVSGKHLHEGRHFVRLNRSRWTLSFSMRIGDEMSEFDPCRGKMFNGYIERADGTGATGDLVPAGDEIRIVAAEALALEDAKAEKIRLIDARTDELIDDGFSYDGQVFSLSSQAQRTLLGAFAGASLLSYPVKWNNIDDTNIAELADESELALFYGTAMSTVEAHKSSGTTLKTQVNAATTIGQVNAVVDPR